MKADRDEYKSWRGMPNVPYKKARRKYTVAMLLNDIVPALTVGTLLASAYYIYVT